MNEEINSHFLNTKLLIKTRLKVLLLVLFVSFILLLILIYKSFLVPININDAAIGSQNWNREITRVDNVTTHDPVVANSQEVNNEFTVESWEVVDNSQRPPLPTGIYFYDTNDGTSAVLKWNDYLVGFTKDYFVAQGRGACFGGCGFTLQTTIRHVRVLNIITGDVYSISLQKPTWGEIDMVSAQIIDNVYFLKVGSYGPKSAGFQYRLPLPPHRNAIIEKLVNPIGTILLKFGNYYLTASCYEGCTYQRVDVTTMESTELSRLTDAANKYNDTRPEQLLGFTRAGEMVIELTETKEVVAVSLYNEKTTRKFLNSEEILDEYSYSNDSKSVKQQFDSFKLDNKYVLEKRTAQYR